MERKQYIVLILVLGALSAIGPFSVDMYLPGFPAIAADLKTDIAHVGYTLTSFFIGISIGQIAYGPIMDRYGRKKPMLIGLLLYVAAALGCAFSSSINLLISLRFLLALGAGVGMAGSRAIVFDLFHGSEAARVLSTLMMVFGIAPVIAPTVGGLVVAAMGWRYIFIALAGLATLTLVTVSQFLRETKGADTTFSLQPKHILREYLNIFKERVFLKHMLAGAAGMAGFFSYLTGSPLLYMKLLGFTEIQFGWIHGANVIGLIIASQINRMWLKRRTSADVLFITTVVQFCFIVALLIGILSGFGGRAGIIGLVFCYVFCIGFVNPNAMALALQPIKRNTGSAVSLIGCFQMVTAASVSGLVSYLDNNTAMPMVLAMAICTGVSLLVLFWKVPDKERQH